MHALAALLALGGTVGGPATATRWLDVGGEMRLYRPHLPAGVASAGPLPVVLALHGMGTNAWIFEAASGLSEAADRHGFLVIYLNACGPTHKTGAWNMDRNGRRPDDLAYILAVLAEMSPWIDPTRVYAVGKSSGGTMAYLFAAEHPERIAAVASVAGPLVSNEFRPGPAVSALLIHGTADPLVPEAGNFRGTPQFARTLPVAKTIASWAAVDGCPAEPSVTRLDRDPGDGTSVEFRWHGFGRDHSEVLHARIHGGGHTWPGTHSPLTLLGPVSREFDANELIWAFFLRHRR